MKTTYKIEKITKDKTHNRTNQIVKEKDNHDHGENLHRTASF